MHRRFVIKYWVWGAISCPHYISYWHTFGKGYWCHCWSCRMDRKFFRYSFRTCFSQCAVVAGVTGWCGLFRERKRFFLSSFD